jgi:hypothetical protein
MKTFSEETVESAINLVLNICGKDFPFGSSELDLIVSTSEWEIVKALAVKSKEQVEVIESNLSINKEKLTSIGVFDDATAIAFIAKRSTQLEKWKAAHDAFRGRVDLELKELRDRFLAENDYGDGQCFNGYLVTPSFKPYLTNQGESKIYWDLISAQKVVKHLEKENPNLRFKVLEIKVSVPTP